MDLAPTSQPHNSQLHIGASGVRKEVHCRRKGSMNRIASDRIVCGETSTTDQLTGGFSTDLGGEVSEVSALTPKSLCDVTQN